MAWRLLGPVGTWKECHDSVSKLCVTCWTLFSQKAAVFRNDDIYIYIYIYIHISIFHHFLTGELTWHLLFSYSSVDGNKVEQAYHTSMPNDCGLGSFLASGGTWCLGGHYHDYSADTIPLSESLELICRPLRWLSCSSARMCDKSLWLHGWANVCIFFT